MSVRLSVIYSWKADVLVDGFHRGNLDRDARLRRLKDLDRRIEVLPCELPRQELGVLAREHERAALKEGEFCRYDSSANKSTRIDV